ncbi:MAG: PP2C family protein-serine/threonine phosphatase [Treponema sp.]|nr:PP2C family protein-serine/threonine phosphatase [Treponema sp.]
MINKIKNAFFTAVIFFVVTMPFREFFKVMEITEMRPASALPPVFGLMLGLPGAFGCAVGNIIADIISGYNPLICAFGFIAQFAYGAFPFLMWHCIKRFDTKEPSVFRLNNVKNVLRYIVIILINSVMMAALLGVIIQAFNISSFFSTTTLMVFLNNFVFCMVLGIPIVIFMSVGNLKERRKRLSLNERLVLIFLFMSVVSAGMIGLFAYMDLSHIMTDPLAMWNRVYFYVAISLFISYLITIAVLHYAEKNVTIPIESIANIVKHYISDGKEKKDSALIAAECELFSRNNNETGILAGAFRTMVLDLETYIDHLTRVTAEKERIGAELAVAAQIQASMLPCIFPPFPDRTEFDIYASMIPAKEVGGDFYDFFLIDENKLAVIIADVSGKGIPAALFMVIAKTLIKNNACLGKSPGEVFETVNNILCENNDTSMFVTAFMGYVDLRNGKFVYVNAGHNPPLVKKAKGDYEFLKINSSFILAGMEDMSYAEYEIMLNAGDVIYLYTDGVTEAMNAELELFSGQRLIEKANKYADCSVKELLVKLKEEIDLFAGGAEQADDITMLALQIFEIKTPIKNQVAIF